MKIIIWGTGNHCDDRLHCYPSIIENVECFVDSCVENGSQGKFYDKPVYNPDVIRETDFDLLLIAVVNQREVILKECYDRYNLDENCIKTIDRYITEKLIDGTFEPGEICLEASTVCQLNCVECYMRKGNYMNLGKGFLKFSDFKKVIDNNPQIHQIELANSGEVFLNPELPKIIIYAYEHNVRLSAWDGVNFNSVSDEVLELLVKTGFRVVTVALDGATQEVYSLYRRNGDFDRVINNIKKLNAYKEKYKSKFPLLNWQYVIMKTNDSEEQLLSARKLADELGMNIKYKLDWTYEYVPKDAAMVKRITGLEYITRRDYDAENKQKCETACMQLFTRPQFNWDGRMFGCKCNSVMSFEENIFNEKLSDIMKSNDFVCARKMITGKAYDSETKVPCTVCKFWKTIEENQSWIGAADNF